MNMRNRFWLSDSSHCPPPPGNWWTVYRVEQVANKIMMIEKKLPEYPIEVIAVDTDCDVYGESFLKVLMWLEQTGRNYPIYIHGKRRNPHVAEAMREIIRRNNWVELPTDVTKGKLISEGVLLNRGLI